jgi:sensor histidine kinase YesM
MFALFLLRVRQLEKTQKERNELNNRIAELKLNALQSQMNPHFVFNVLNSIQDGYLNNDIMQANRYMSDFAKLMRLFLESSDEKYITLKKELELLSYYIELEKMRLDNKFEYEFIIDPEIDLEEVKLPTMLIQPIIENAIMHGLRYKEELGRLSVQISVTSETTMLIAIEDNGIGRSKSAEMNKKRLRDHESKASNIIRDRIDIINKSGTERIEMKYVDLFDGTTPTGTRVELMLDLEINR